MSRWHSRLGHPSSIIVQQVLSQNRIYFASESNKEQVCDACQKARVISYLIPCQQVYHQVLLSSYSLMYGVLPPPLLAKIIICEFY